MMQKQNTKKIKPLAERLDPSTHKLKFKKNSKPQAQTFSAPKLPGPRYSSHDGSTAKMAQNMKMHRDYNYVVSNMKQNMSSGQNEAGQSASRIKSEVRLSDQRKNTPNSTKSKSQSSAAAEKKKTMESVKSLGNIYYSQKHLKQSQEPRYLTPGSQSKLAATLDPRQFRAQEHLLESQGPVNLDLKMQKSSTKRSSSNSRTLDSKNALLNNYLMHDESPRENMNLYKEARHTQVINSNAIGRDSSASANLYFEMDGLAKPKNNSVPKNSNLYSSMKQQTLSKQNFFGAEPLSRGVRTSHPDQIIDQLGEPGRIKVVNSVERRSIAPQRQQQEDENGLSSHELLQNISSLEKANHEMRTSFSKMAVSMNGLMGACLKVKKSSEAAKRPTSHGQVMQDISQHVESLNAGINEIQFNLLRSDNDLQNLSSQCIEFDDILKKSIEHRNMDAQLQKLTNMHQSLQNKMYTQTLENKKLKSEIKKNHDSNHDQKYMQTYAIENLEKMLQEQRSDNKMLVCRIDELEKELQLKDCQQEEQPRSELKWITSSEKLMEQSQKFLAAMKKLQKVVQLNRGSDKDENESIHTPKQQFEMHKKLLEQAIKETRRQLSDVSFEASKKDNEEVGYLKQHIKFQEEQLKTFQARVDDLTHSVKQREQQLRELKRQHTVEVEAIAERNRRGGQRDAETQSHEEDQARVQPDSGSLQKLKTAARDLEAQRDQLQHQVNTQDTAINNLKEQNRTLTTQLEIVRQNALAQDENDQRQAELDSQKLVAQQAQEALEKAKIEHEVQEYQLDNEIAVLKQKVRAQNSELQDQIKAERELKDTAERLKTQSDAKQERIEALQQQASKVRGELEQASLAIKQLQGDAERAGSEKQELQRESAESKVLIEGLQSDYKEVNDKLFNYISREKQFENEINDLRESLMTFEERISEKEKAVKDLQAVLDEKHHVHQVLQLQTEESERKLRERENTEKRLKDEVERLKRMTAHLDDMVQAKANLQQKYDELIARVNSQGEEGRLQKSAENEATPSLGQNNEQELQNEIERLTNKLLNSQTDLHQRETELDGRVKEVGAMDEQIKELEDRIQQLNGDLSEAEQIRQKHQLTLEKNRDLISMLKEQLQKSVDKQKGLEQKVSQDKTEIQQEKISLLQSELSKNKRELEKANQTNQVLKEQVTQLKLQFQDKMGLLSGQIDGLQVDKAKQEELINEANTAIEELTGEKHDVAAKLKHLLQVYVNKLTDSENQSSYKGEDSSLSIGDCFEKIQGALEENQRAGALDADPNRAPRDPELVAASPVGQNNEEAAKQLALELEGHRERYTALSRQLQESETQVERNGQLLDAHLTQLRNGKRKVENYKAKLEEKCRELHKAGQRIKSAERELEKVKQQKLAVEATRVDLETSQKASETQVLELNSRNIQLKAKIDYKESQRKDMERQVALLKDELAKLAQKNEKSIDRSNHSKSELVEQLEMENMELLAKLAQTEKELQEQRRSHESTAQDLNDSCVKLDSDAVEKLDRLQKQIGELHQKLFLAKGEVVDQIRAQFDQQVRGVKDHLLGSAKLEDLTVAQAAVVNDEMKEITRFRILGATYAAVHLIQEVETVVRFLKLDSLSKEAVTSLEHFSPGYFNEQELPCSIFNGDFNLDKAEVPNEHMEQFILQLRELRQEQREIARELAELRAGAEQNLEFEIQKDAQALRDDVQFFTAENLEIRLKIKALVMQNLEQKQRIADLNKAQDTRRQNSGGSAQWREPSLPSLREDDRAIFNLSAITSSLQENMTNNRSPGSRENQRVRYEGSLLSAERMEMFAEQSGDENKQSAVRVSDIEVLEAASEADQSSSLSQIGGSTAQQQQAEFTNPHNLTDLEQQLKDANTRIRELMRELKQSTQRRAEELKVDPEVSLASASSTESIGSILQHVKGTLIMYLKKTPIIDGQTEALLTIIFSMLKFSEKEIRDLRQAREELPVYTVDGGKTKQMRRDREASAKKSNSALSNSNHSYERTSGVNGSQGTIRSNDLRPAQQANSLYYVNKNTSQSRNQGSPAAEKIKDKMKLNIMGMFKRDKDANVIQASNSSRPQSNPGLLEVKGTEFGSSFNN